MLRVLTNTLHVMFRSGVMHMMWHMVLVPCQVLEIDLDRRGIDLEYPWDRFSIDL